jgi:NodT family efflux transporter outer membrane factor (OMF) lipoprotein
MSGSRGLLRQTYRWQPLIVAAALSGCAVGPDFRPPAPPLLNRYTEADAAPDTAAAEVPGGAAQHLSIDRDIPGDWWTLFHSPAINSLVVDALRQSPTVEAANAQLRQAQEQELAQRGTLFPTVSGTVGVSRQQEPQTYLYGTTTPALSFNDYQARLDLSYTLDFWGGLRRRVEQAHAQVDYQRFQLEAAYLTLSAGVVTTAVQVASLRQQTDVQIKLNSFEQQQLDTVRQQFEAGGATGTDVATQEAQVAQGQLVVQSLQTRLAQARDQLAAYLGRAPSEVAIPDIDLNSLALPTDIPVSLPSKLVAQRPDIRAAESLLHQQTAALGVATAARLPNVTLSASGGSDAATLNQLFTRSNVLWSMGTQAVQPLFDAGQLKHAQRAQSAQMQVAAAQWRNQVVTAFQNVADVLAQLRSDALSLRYALNAEQAAARSLFLASEQFKLGGVSYLSVLTSEQSYQSAASALIQARAARFADTISLYQALGGGWWNREDPQPLHSASAQ